MHHPVFTNVLLRLPFLLKNNVRCFLPPIPRVQCFWLLNAKINTRPRYPTTMVTFKRFRPMLLKPYRYMTIFVFGMRCRFCGYPLPPPPPLFPRPPFPTRQDRHGNLASVRHPHDHGGAAVQHQAQRHTGETANGEWRMSAEKSTST